MSRNQTRRTIVLSSALYDRLLAYCAEHNRTCSSVVEQVLAGNLIEGRMPPRTEPRSWMSRT